MQYRLTPAVLACLLLAACSAGPSSPSSSPAGTGPQSAPSNAAASGAQPTAAASGPNSSAGQGGALLHLVLSGGAHEGTYDLSHSNPCGNGIPDAASWSLTVTFPGSTTGPTIVDIKLSQQESYADVWFGNDEFKASDLEFNVDDRGSTATMTATGNASAVASGGQAIPLELSVECGSIVRYGS